MPQDRFESQRLFYECLLEMARQLDHAPTLEERAARAMKISEAADLYSARLALIQLKRKSGFEGLQ